MEHDAFDRGYVAVNRLFADAVADEVQAWGGRALVMLHDYHFYLVTEQVRRRCPQALLSHFVHIPWPGPDIWGMLPAAIREQLLRGLLGADVVGFQTRRFARNFLRCCQDLLGLDVDTAASTVTADGRTVRVRHYPISVDPAAPDRVAASPAAAEHARSLTEAFHGDDRKLVLRVDRTDPSKYVVRGFLAFGTLLDEHPELEGRVSFLALLQPSRTDVPEYSDYIAQIGAVVAEVNARHTKEGRQPIDMRMACIDLDAHHGDGVQTAFYRNPQVLTISLHESGYTAFPGTGFPDETGGGAATGYAVNVALPPRPGDAGWLRAFHAVVPRLLRAFQPEILITQHGCDTHRLDPLANLDLTVDAHRASYAALHQLAHQVTGGRWVALGGGGYDAARVVPRSWTHLLAETTGNPLDPDTETPQLWRQLARRYTGRQPPESLTDGATPAYRAWDAGNGDRYDRLDCAVAATRRAVFPEHGLDPYDPR